RGEHGQGGAQPSRTPLPPAGRPRILAQACRRHLLPQSAPQRRYLLAHHASSWLAVVTRSASSGSDQGSRATACRNTMARALSTSASALGRSGGSAWGSKFRQRRAPRGIRLVRLVPAEVSARVTDGDEPPPVRYFPDRSRKSAL